MTLLCAVKYALASRDTSQGAYYFGKHDGEIQRPCHYNRCPLGDNYISRFRQRLLGHLNYAIHQEKDGVDLQYLKAQGELERVLI